jgi:uncharacterized protein (TIGR00106 family)
MSSPIGASLAPVPSTEGLTALDRERAASLADEGGVAGAIVERQDDLEPGPAASISGGARSESRSGSEREASMLFEVSVIPLGGDIHLSDELAGVLSVVDRSGLPYQLGPGSTCIEAEWDEAMALIRECHREARRSSKHVITLIKVEDDDGQRGKIRSNVQAVEAKAGRPLETCADSQVRVQDVKSV